MTRKNKQVAPQNVEQSFEIERVDLENRKTLDNGQVLVAVKWVGYDELTFEPIENVTETEAPVVKETKKRNANKTKQEPPEKKRKTETKKVQIDYMSHSLMTDEEDMLKQQQQQQQQQEGASLSTVAPAMAKKTNASRARRENITIEEQMHRSAEMRDIVAQNLQTEEVKPNLCYSSTDESKDDKAFIPVKPPLFILPPVVSQVPPATLATMFPYNNVSKQRIQPQLQQQQQQEKPIANIDDCGGDVSFLRKHSTKTSVVAKAMREENWEENSALENIKDEGNQPLPGHNVCHTTLSTEMQERNYKAYGINSFFRDTQFVGDVELERKLMGVAVRNLCRVNGEDDKNPEAQRRSLAQIESAGLGHALVCVQSLCASAQQRKASNDTSNVLTKQFQYPLQWDLRCFHDQHRFTTIPIFIPLAFYPERDMVSILTSVCFCSFSCAKTWIKQRGLGAHEQGSLAHHGESDEIMLSIFARKYFGINEEIKYAAPLHMHEDNGGPLNTKQWRALGTTHRTILREPLCVAAPSTFVAEVYVRSRKDAGKVARIVKRTEETHFNAVPERPERNSADAAEAAKRKLKEGAGRPLKERQTIDASGNRITLDDEQLEKHIEAGAIKRGQKKGGAASSKATKAKVESLSSKKSSVAKVTTF